MNMRQYHAEERARQAKQRADAMAEAAQLRVQYPTAVDAVFNFDGSGDEGQVEPGVLVGPGGELGEIDSGMEALQDYVYTVLSLERGGWEINAGSFGTVRVSLVTLAGKIEMNTRTESSEYSEDEF